VGMKIEIKKFMSGERYVFLLDDDDMPDFWVTHFVTNKLRKNLTTSSIQQYYQSQQGKRNLSVFGRALIYHYSGVLPFFLSFNFYPFRLTYVKYTYNITICHRRDQDEFL
jgi:hypothetical protein